MCTTRNYLPAVSHTARKRARRAAKRPNLAAKRAALAARVAAIFGAKPATGSNGAEG